jgi:peptidoglycan/LPS O-acetylase OafA/YrhL
LHHAAFELPTRLVNRSLVLYTNWLSQGPAAVPVFIVLSGFCLMIPVAKTGYLDGGFWPYIGRRARRILPAYYACMVFVLALIAFAPLLNHSSDPRWTVALPALDLWTSIFPHALLYHNWQAAWAYKIDPPMWSIAAEWQIYFLFPVLVAVWRRWGVPALLAAGMAVPLLCKFLMITQTWRLVSPWYVGLFAMGMAGAIHAFAPKREHAWSDRTPWFTVVMIGTLLTFLGWDFILRDVLTGVATVTLLVFCANHASSIEGTVRPVALRLLESRALVTLGAFSYSIYLVHYPIIALANGWLASLGIGVSARLILMLLVVSPLAVVVSYAFHIMCEKPFMPGRPRSIRTTPHPAILSPAT